VSAGTWPLFLAAAALGAILRYEAGRLHEYGILAVNLAGSLALGVLVGRASAHGLGATWMWVIGSGLCGSLTTFSTVAADVAARPRARLRYGMITLVGCVGVGALGVVIGRW
jgi:CrcB protein